MTPEEFKEEWSKIREALIEVQRLVQEMIKFNKEWRTNMNEELQKELAENLSTITEYVKQGAGFVQEQAPLLVQEMINYGIGSNIFRLIMAIVILGVGFWGFTNNSRDNKLNFDEVGLVVTGVLGFGLGSIMFLISSSTLMQIFLAPRLYILDQLKGLF